MVVHVDLVADAVRARCDRETQRIAFGHEESSAFVDEPDPRRRSDATGFLALKRPDGDACAAAVGRTAAVEFFTFDRAERTAWLEAAAIDGGELPQRVRVRLNDEREPLAAFTLTDVANVERHAIELPADRVRVGTNRLHFDFENVIEWRHPVTGFRYPLAAFFVSLAFERLGETERRGQADIVVGSMPGGGGRAPAPGFQLEEGTRVSFALRVPRRGARFRACVYAHPGEPAGNAVPLIVRVRPEIGDPTTVFDAGIATDGSEAVTLDTDLAGFAERVVSLEFESPPKTVRPRRVIITEAAVLGRFEPGSEPPQDGGEALPPSPNGTNLVLITCDAAAARRFSAYGAERENAPTIDALARRGFVFERTTSPASYTLASVGSLFTGLWPDSHGVVQQGNTSGVIRLSAETTTLAERLERAGYRTMALVTNPNAGATYGYDRGFQTYEPLYSPELGLWNEGVAADRLAPHLATKLDTLSARDPFFLYVHVFQPHAPYTPPEEFLQGVDAAYEGPVDGSRASIDAFREHEIADYDADDFRAFRDRYDANLRFGDAGVAQVLELLGTRGLMKNTIVAIVADHGEALGEHRSLEHGDTIYAEQVDVPWILVLPPDDAPPTGRVACRASLVDVCPTLLSLLSIPYGKETFDGLDLSSQLESATTIDRPIFLRSHGALPRFGVRDDGFSYHADCFTGGEELYRLDTDPDEKHDLSASNPIRTELLRTTVCRFLCERSGRTHKRAALSDDAIRQMKEIGYVGTDVGESLSCPLLRRAPKR